MKHKQSESSCSAATSEPSDLDSFQIGVFKQDNKTPARHELVIVERVIKKSTVYPPQRAQGQVTTRTSPTSRCN